MAKYAPLALLLHYLHQFMSSYKYGRGQHHRAIVLWDRALLSPRAPMGGGRSTRQSLQSSKRRQYYLVHANEKFHERLAAPKLELGGHKGPCKNDC